MSVTAFRLGMAYFAIEVGRGIPTAVNLDSPPSWRLFCAVVEEPERYESLRGEPRHVCSVFLIEELVRDKALGFAQMAHTKRVHLYLTKCFLEISQVTFEKEYPIPPMQLKTVVSGVHHLVGDSLKPDTLPVIYDVFVIAARA